MTLFNRPGNAFRRGSAQPNWHNHAHETLKGLEHPRADFVLHLEEHFVLSEGLGPTDSYDTPILLTLFQRKGRLGGVEFTRFDGDPNYFPDPREWTVGPFEFIP